MGRERRKPGPAAEPKEARDPEVSEAYSVEYLAEAASGDARQERLAELKRRIALGAYKPDPDAIAEGMLARVDLGGQGADEEREEAEDPDELG
ncbi:MAG TPA: flagellar biosynthesis anti-sigma factor FlgM [Myxococcota bacterium]|nr:flagellar biosynthesis anti-sigma factor FlgM [Myxococcota bacterium]